MGITAALAGGTGATVQLVGRDAPQCFSATFDTVRNNSVDLFRAK